MNLKEELGKLYPSTKVYGPYCRKDQRTYFVLVALNEFGKTTKKGLKTSILKSRAMMEIQLGRILDSSEEVDHKDGDKTNDTLENLQVIEKIDHKKKSWKDQFGHLISKKVALTCPICETKFERRVGTLRPSSTIYVCSRKCLHFWSSKIRTKHNQHPSTS